MGRHSAISAFALLRRLAALAAPAAASAEQTRPNVLVVMTDDQTAESMRVMPRTQRADRRDAASSSAAAS